MPNPAATLRLFCFHYAGGSAQVFHDWPRRLPPSVEMGAIQLPGRGHTEPPLECPMTIYGGLEDHEVEADNSTWREWHDRHRQCADRRMGTCFRQQ
ncbi:MAG: thioesterase II family protein [Blastocatellia bacterium]